MLGVTSDNKGHVVLWHNNRKKTISIDEADRLLQVMLAVARGTQCQSIEGIEVKRVGSVTSDQIRILYFGHDNRPDIETLSALELTFLVNDLDLEIRFLRMVSK